VALILKKFCVVQRRAPQTHHSCTTNVVVDSEISFFYARRTEKLLAFSGCACSFTRNICRNVFHLHLMLRSRLQRVFLFTERVYLARNVSRNKFKEQTEIFRSVMKYQNFRFSRMNASETSQSDRRIVVSRYSATTESLVRDTERREIFTVEAYVKERGRKGGTGENY